MTSNEIKDQNFQKPWHAKVFAITVSLSEKKIFKWSEFSDFLSYEIFKHKTLHRDGSDDYFNSWLKALEKLLISKKITNKSNILKIKNLWINEFLITPHGKPVKIGDD